MNTAEVIMWSKLNRRQMAGQKFRRQYGVGSFIVDFYCAQMRLAIEIDGDSHFRDGAAEYDKARQKRIEQYGIRFLRFTNPDVYHNLSGVLQRIYEVIEEIRNSRPGKTIHHPTASDSVQA